MSSRVPTTRKPAFDENDGVTLQYQLEYNIDQPSTLSDGFFEILQQRAMNYLKFYEYLLERKQNK